MLDFWTVMRFLALYWFVNGCLNVFRFLPGVAGTDRPLDGGRSFTDGRRILGPSTTLLGLPVALVAGLAAGFGLTGWPSGLLFGGGVYFGHALGSFIKRRAGRADGGFLPLVDHVDSLLLAGMAMLLVSAITWPNLLAALGLNLVCQPLLCYLGYRLRLRARPL